MSARPRIAFVTRELYPFCGGGIAPIIAGLSRDLAAVADVTLLTTAHYRAEAERLGGAPALYGAGVELLFAEEPAPGTHGHYASYMHDWSGRAFAALERRFADRGPDLVEFCDYLAEGFVTIQARRMGEPFLRQTRLVVRTHTTGELAAILNGALPSDDETTAVSETERYCLRHADTLVYSGGDVLATYERYYGAHALAPGRRVLESFHTDFEPGDPEPDPPAADAPLQMLYLGRLERRKGVQTLIRALARTGYENWRLTLLGSDTDTAPLAGSMREYLEFAAGVDDRITFAEPVPRKQVGTIIAAHDLMIVPSLWECWPNTVREAFLHNRPVVATPTGGLVEMVEPGISGWVARDASAAALLDVLESLFRDPDAARQLIRAGGPRAAYDRLVDPERTRREYLELIETPIAPRTRRVAGAPTVAVVVPYFEMETHVAETLDSIEAQTTRVSEVVVVNDGSLRGPDHALDRLAEERGVLLVTQPNTGLGAARNLGIRVATARYVLPLDPDNVLEPEFVERCLWALEHDERLAYATTWSRYIDEQGEPLASSGYPPLGNWTRMVDRANWAGDGTALLRRRIFDLGYAYSVELTSYEDWFLYRQLHHAGLHGDVIPRRLFRYRVRADSMLRSVGLRRNERIADEMNALILEGETRWTPRNG
jgi:glycosyltransferase involved in cell wall biosynthesis